MYTAEPSMSRQRTKRCRAKPDIKGMKKRWRNLAKEQGSITLEAALIMPLFVAFMFFFYVMLIAISSQMALQHVAAQSVQRVASFIHPAALTAEYVNTHVFSNKQANVHNADEGIRSLVYELGAMLPHPLNTIVEEGSKGNYWPAANLATTVIGRELFEGLIASSNTHPILNKDGIKLVYLQMPDLIQHTDQSVIIALQYDLPFKILGYQFSVREQAMQRVWLPDPLAASFEIDDSEEVGEQPFISVVSIEPNPLKPGRKATIKAATLPNRPISLEVIYKSGSSVAKNLGTVTANERGEVQWTWHVSGNTTPGTWLMELALLEPRGSLKQPLEVRK